MKYFPRQNLLSKSRLARSLAAVSQSVGSEGGEASFAQTMGRTDTFSRNRDRAALPSFLPSSHSAHSYICDMEEEEEEETAMPSLCVPFPFPSVVSIQASAQKWSIGCVKCAPVARGGQDAGFTQPRDHSYADPRNSRNII